MLFYRDNGGANAGHTVEFNQTKIVLHQLGAGVLQNNATFILGKEMVLHPQDLVSEIQTVYQALNTKKLPANLMIDEMTFKATFTSSVGERVLPTKINKKLVERIRNDANEYGAATGRPRDIVHIDLPMLSFLFKVSKTEELVMTHLDISYPDVPIKISVAYKLRGKEMQLFTRSYYL